MNRKIIQCDRCSKEIEARQEGEILVFKGETLDLCQECSAILDGWLRGTSSKVPPGYKRVARSCPHHVPCAEPWGCSGDEIVRDSDPRPSLDELGF